MCNLNEYKALRTLVDAQQEILMTGDPEQNSEILRKVYELKELLLKDEENNNAMKKDEYPQEIHFDGENLNLIQYTNGGKYILWSLSIPEYINCGIGYNIDKEDNDDYEIDEDIFATETKIGDYAEEYGYERDNKNIDFYLYEGPFDEDYTLRGKLEYDDIKEALEEE